MAYLHYHNEFELLLATRGTLCVQMEEANYIILEGEGIFINSGRLHSISSHGEGEHEFIAVVFDYTLLCSKQEAAFTRYFQPLILGTLKINEKLPPNICQLINTICEVYEADSFGKELYMKQLLLNVFYLLMKDAESIKPEIETGKSLLVKEVLDYIKCNYTDPISLTHMAKQVHVSKEYLCRIFRTLSDSSPIEYLNRYRIHQSTFLLAQSNKSISEIAEACGFNHSSYYGKLFYIYMGCTPTEYRNTNRILKKANTPVCL